MQALTDLFLALTPDRVLDAVDAAGLRCTPGCFQLNSYENRVYDVALEDGSHVVAKFYRPTRWTRAQILEEHAFLADLAAAEIEVCDARPFPGGGTLRLIDGIFYAVFDRRGGRAPEEVDAPLAERLGMLIARMHAVGASRPAPHRLALTPTTLIRDNLRWLVAHDALPLAIRPRYLAAANALAALADDRLRGVPVQRVHGDCHLGNLLLRDGVLRVLDLDDMATGPVAQDLWMVLPGERGPVVEAFIEGYQRFGRFDRRWLSLFGPLRAMRRVSYAAWLARRWHDPLFPATWPDFGTAAYWEEEAADLEALLLAARRGAPASEAAPEPAAPEALTNADYFWDLDDA